MKNYYNLLAIILLIALLSVLFASQAKGQSQSKSPPKVNVVKKEIISNESGQEIELLLEAICDDSAAFVSDGDSLSKHIVINLDEGTDGQIYILKIINGDTIINKGWNDSLMHSWNSKLNMDSMQYFFHNMEKAFKFSTDSLMEFEFDTVFDQGNWENCYEYEIHNSDSLANKTLEMMMKPGKSHQIVIIDDDSEPIRIEKEGEMVFISNPSNVTDCNNHVEVVRNEAGEKVIVVQSSIVLDNLSDEEKSEQNSMGVDLGKKEPNFDFIKFYPNPSKKVINIHFKLKDTRHVAVRITNMLGQVVYEENISDFNGEYKQAVNLKQYGKGTYVLQVEQGKQLINRKIIVE